jgi:ubiquinol-cytochrome c reductase subunit 6
MTLFDISRLFPTVYAEAAVDDQPEDNAEEEEEEEAEEPEDHMPAIVEACEQSAECTPAKRHLDECAARVAAGANENCVEEFFHLMHCVDDCVSRRYCLGRWIWSDTDLQLHEWCVFLICRQHQRSLLSLNKKWQTLSYVMPNIKSIIGEGARLKNAIKSAFVACNMWCDNV